MTTTLAQLLDPANDHRALRSAAAEVLTPGPWKHDWQPDDLNRMPCEKWHCGKPGCDARQKLERVGKNVFLPARLDKVYGKPCLIPDPVTGPLEVVARRLKDEVFKRHGGKSKLVRAAGEYWKESIGNLRGLQWTAALFEKWLEATTAEQCACCLLALGKAEI